MEELYNITYIILISLLPSLVWLHFVLKKDIHPEKFKNIFDVFFLGMVVSIPVLSIYFIGNNLINILNLEINHLLSSFIFGALNEELIKFVVFYIFVFRSKFCDEPIDIFVYSGTLALGFAGIENIFVSLSSIQSVAGELEMILFLRTITAVLVHLISTFLFAYAFYIYKYNKNKLYLMLGISLSIGFHSIYNFILALSKLKIYNVLNYLEYIYILIFLPMFVYMLYLVSKLQKASK